jgi:hypothetical protein
MEGPSWLDRAPLPVGKELVREICSDGYRDRYLILSAKELQDWHAKNFSEIKSASLAQDPLYARQLAEFEAHPGKARESDIYIAHWYEWESGL